MSAGYQLRSGTTPLLVSMPHVGTHLPDGLEDRLTPAALLLPDTDWHVHELYDFLEHLGAGCIRADYSRYVVDLNRLPDGASLYPGQSVTEICPTTLFTGQPLYEAGAAPGAQEISERIEQYWQPYHRALRDELARLVQAHGYALLWDAHSIASRVPRFFEGQLPDLNIGTAGGDSCAPELAAAVEREASTAVHYSSVRDGRFKGGAITRLYGDPARGVHAIQMELSQRTYMEERAPYRFDEALARGIRPVLKACLEAFLHCAERSGDSVRVPGN